MSVEINVSFRELVRFHCLTESFKSDIDKECNNLKEALAKLKLSSSNEEIEQIKRCVKQVEEVLLNSEIDLQSLIWKISEYERFVVRLKMLSRGDTLSVSNSTATLNNGIFYKAVESIDSVQTWIGDINPNYYNSSLPNQKAYHCNCGSCAFAVEQRLSGTNSTIQASAQNIPTDALMEKATGKKCKYMSVKQIEKILVDSGPGSHLIVGINRKPVIIAGKKINQPGHWFNAYYDGQKIYTIEGQSGKVYDWPHDYGDISEWCALI